jgi:4-hydroxythreonine-4-phosphate dehydrogenase
MSKIDAIGASMPRVALTVGDPAGIGPEIVLAALADPVVRRRLRILVLGPGSLRPDRVPLHDRGSAIETSAWIETFDPGRWNLGEVQASCGRAAISALRAGHDLAIAGEVDALVTGPVSKRALHLGGEEVEGQTELLGRWSNVQRLEMIGISGSLRVMLLTRHLPLARAIASITKAAVVDRLLLFEATLRSFGIESPRLAIAGLNPHAGEGGVLGDEETEILEPAVLEAREAGVDVLGPRSPDTVFLEASRGAFHGVLALYHDQAFIPLKLLSNGKGVTVLAGLPYLRVSPVHGTAFDIAGRGIASPENLIAAMLQAGEWSRHRTFRRTEAN